MTGWQKFRRAFRDASAPLKDARAMLLRLLAVLALLGFGVAAWREEDYFLPSTLGGRIVLILLGALLYLVAVETAHRLNAKIDDLRQGISAVPPADRDLIIRLRTVAGRATDLLTSAEPSRSAASRNMERLRRIGGNLRHYPGVYSAARRLADALEALDYRGGRADEFSAAVRRAEEAYGLLMTACDSVLKPLPAQPGRE